MSWNYRVISMEVVINNSERIQLLKLVNAEVRKATSSRPFAGRQKLETLYELQRKLALPEPPNTTTGG